jgi:hypothetical protein
MACIHLKLGTNSSAIVTVADSYGECVIAGKTWRWEFHNYLGPTFLRKDGEMLKNQPSERHPVWDKFNEWLTEYRKTRPIR